ncbi:MAG: flagellar biosynthesis anti-sigma factor FlgM [Treponema sp.]|uniref:flagellar biosynthesis anti-sigma factor FlgM n=1 Tax=Treponema sp. TaxID=166 RepID=UPI001B5B959C|nr:flagellar biosynthesis anti-sigma factor FlgM [Treponema sp.]MBP5402538.1 flagellar biosynthesis anti-sigma factor FlgM [Treponema sp.]MBR5933877.1 flagellar biosynthesis anti-sigma factor FlgM [Treponema sp.]
MMIDKLGGITPLNNVQSTKRTQGTESVKSSPDSISVSKEAKEMAEAYYLKEVADETPDVRADLVAQIKEKIKDPSYLSSEILNSTAERIMASYGI